MKKIKTWLWRVLTLALFPYLTYGALYGGSATAANALPFLAWTSLVVNALAFFALVSATDRKPETLGDLADALAPRWWQFVGNITAGIVIAQIVTHAWYWTAIGLALASFASALVRLAVADGIKAYEAAEAQRREREAVPIRTSAVLDGATKAMGDLAKAMRGIR